MIVQTSLDGQSAFVITQQDHADVSGIFAEHFGNETFEIPSPREEMIYVARHHDDGWQAVDSAPEWDSRTGFVYHLTQTPLPYLVKTSEGSPSLNEAHHPYCGIMSSMHTYGLFNGRYGLSDKVYIDMIGDEFRPQVQAMLDAELTRQERLKTEIHDTHDVSESALFHNYKLLQFFDTLALYVQTVCAENLTESTFIRVPMSQGNDIDITATPQGDNVITLSPYPFDVYELTVSTKGRMMSIAPDGIDNMQSLFDETPIATQTFTFQRG